jgi:hypothetical protein
MSEWLTMNYFERLAVASIEDKGEIRHERVANDELAAAEDAFPP